jgi:hypothetical protein
MKEAQSMCYTKWKKKHMEKGYELTPSKKGIFLIDSNS